MTNKTLTSFWMVFLILCWNWKSIALRGDLKYIFSSAESKAVPKAPLDTLNSYVHGPRGHSSTYISVSTKQWFEQQKGGEELAAWLLPN